MSENRVPVTVDQVKAIVAARATEDAAFRNRLLENPVAAMESLFEVPLPPQLKVSVIEEAPDTYVVVIPARQPDHANGELSDQDLEGVAGGAKASLSEEFPILAPLESGKSFGSFVLMAPVATIGASIGVFGKSATEAGSKMTQGANGALYHTGGACSSS